MDDGFTSLARLGETGRQSNDGGTFLGRLGRFFTGGPAPMEPDLSQTQAGAQVTPGMTRRPNVLPFTADAETGELQFALPRLADLAMNMLGSPATRAAKTLAGTAENLASRSVSMYDPPSKPVRPIEADYRPERWPDGPPADASGRLTQDIEGRPLVAERVVGRRLAESDHALPPEAFDAVTAAGTGGRAPVVASRIPGGGVGAVELWPGTKDPKQVWYKAGLSETDLPRVKGHETGHVIDLLAGTVPQKGLSAELKDVYNTLNNGNRDGAEVATWGKPSTPRSGGYSAAEAPAEYMAEAIRAYMADPNYLKTVAPKTAAAIRAAVNTNPRLSPFIQFNSLGGLAAGGMAAGALADWVAADPKHRT